MNIYINSEKSPAAVQAKATGSPVSSLRLKRGANLNLSVIVMGSTTACNLRFGIKTRALSSRMRKPLLGKLLMRA